MECSECGADLKPSQKFCGDCGIEIEWPGTPEVKINVGGQCEHKNVEKLFNREYCWDCVSYLDTPSAIQKPTSSMGEAGSSLNSNSNSNRVEPRFSQNQKIAIGFGILGLLVAAVFALAPNGSDSSGGYTSSSSGQTTTSNSNDSTQNTSSWPPAGYEKIDSNNAYKRLTVGSYTCDSTKCAKAYFISKKGCTDSMDVQVNFLDTNGNIVQNGIDNTSVVPAGVPVLLTFDATEDSANDYKVVKINCFQTSDFGK